MRKEKKKEFRKSSRVSNYRKRDDCKTSTHQLLSPQSSNTTAERRLSLVSFISKAESDNSPTGSNSGSVISDVIPGEVLDRYYYESLDIFNCVLDSYNSSKTSETNPERSNFESKGLVNVGMRLCSRCLDSGKRRGDTDLYYIDTKEIAQTRLILCRGCLGYRMKTQIESEVLKIIFV